MRTTEFFVVGEFLVMVIAMVIATIAGSSQGSAISDVSKSELVRTVTAGIVVGVIVVVSASMSPTWTSQVEREIGLVMTSAGLLIALCAYLNLGRSFSGNTKPNSRHELKTDGVYAVARHPVYLGMGLFAVGSALVFERWPFAILALACLWQLRRQSESEESQLRDRYPDEYDDYSKRTKRWVEFPRSPGHDLTNSSPPFNRPAG